jgi:hypothetical protein
VNTNRSARAARIGAGAGTALVVLTSLVGGSWSSGLVLFTLWALLPWAVLAFAGTALPDAWTVVGAGASMFAVEAGVRASVFLWPRGSTAAVALVFSPVVVAAAALPGALGGCLVGRAWRSRRISLRVAAMFAAGAALGLTTLGLARPELFPTAVLRRRAMLARIGTPRVVVGADAFEEVLVSDRAAWHVAGAFDDGAGYLVAVVDNRGADLLDPIDFRVREHVNFAPVRGGLWNSFSTLARLDGRLVVVQTGGGFSDVEVRELDGHVLWSYRPDPTLPPTALQPADLDGDGQLEFYSSDQSATVRLDGAGHEVWRRATRMAHLVAVAPRTRGGPGWVAALEYARVVRVWDEQGEPLAELPVSADDVLVGIVDWPEARALTFGGAAVRGIALDGTPVFEIPLGDFRASQVLAARFGPAARPHLVVAAGAPRDVGRWRLLVLSPERRVVYEKILDRPIRLVKARAPDGSETVFLSGNGLRALRPR